MAKLTLLNRSRWQNCVEVFRELERSHRLTLHISDVAEGHRRARVDSFQDKLWVSHDRFGSSCSRSWAGYDLNMFQGANTEMNTIETSCVWFLGDRDWRITAHCLRMSSQKPLAPSLPLQIENEVEGCLSLAPGRFETQIQGFLHILPPLLSRA